MSNKKVGEIFRHHLQGLTADSIAQFQQKQKDLLIAVKQLLAERPIVDFPKLVQDLREWFEQENGQTIVMLENKTYGVSNVQVFHEETLGLPGYAVTVKLGFRVEKPLELTIVILRARPPH